MSLAVVANAGSVALFHSQAPHAPATSASVVRTAAHDPFASVDRIRKLSARASRDAYRDDLRERLAQKRAQRPPRVTCWDGTVVVEHPHVRDCPPRPAPAPAPAAPTTASVSGTWAAIAECESGGNPAANTGNGYYGLLQFDMQTWLAYDGDDFASRPDLASAGQQIVVAERVRDGYSKYPPRGYSAWPVCGA